MNRHKKTILIDLDGVLNQYNGNYNENEIPPIKEGAREFLEYLNNLYEIKLFTSRPMKIASRWVFDNELEEYISDVTNLKLPSYLIIDDRTICHNGNFQETLENIEKFNVHWKCSPSY